MRIRDWDKVKEHVNDILRRAKVSLKTNFQPDIELSVQVIVKPMCEHLLLILVDNQEMHIIHEDIENHLIFDDHEIVRIFKRL